MLKYLDEFKDKDIADKLAGRIRKLTPSDGKLIFMEVCGTHTMAIFRNGIKDLMPEEIKLSSGPGCPVCVTETSYIDKAVAISKLDDVIITTFGDMLHVPGSSSSLEDRKVEGAKVEVVYSAFDSLKIARQNSDKKVIFLAVGFETTSPTIAMTILKAREMKIKNFYVLCAHKLIPPAMKVLLEDKDIKIDGFICPAHVSTIIGAKSYEFIAKDYKKPCVVAGFEAIDILQGVMMLTQMKKEGRCEVQNQYKRIATYNGNEKAVDTVNEVFEVQDAEWRGLGTIPASGLKVREKFREFDAEKMLKFSVEETREEKGCLCGEILKGKKEPVDCPSFASRCTPVSPVGPCMVSTEGTCAAWYKYGRDK